MSKADEVAEALAIAEDWLVRWEGHARPVASHDELAAFAVVACELAVHPASSMTAWAKKFRPGSLQECNGRRYTQVMGEGRAPDFKAMSIEIGRQAAEYPELPKGPYFNGQDKTADLREGLKTAMAVAVYPYLELVWELAQQHAGTGTVTPAATGRFCACGCEQPVTSPRPEAKYATGACRVRVLRRRSATEAGAS